MSQVLKYPGSKQAISSDIVALIPEHHSYVEPFFGNRKGTGMSEVDTEFECVSRQEKGVYGRAFLYTDNHVVIELMDGRKEVFETLLDACEEYTIY